MEVILGTHRAEAMGFVGLFLLPFPMLVSLLTALFCALLHIPCSLIIPCHSLFLGPTKVLSPFLVEKRLERWFLQVEFQLNTHFL